MTTGLSSIRNRKIKNLLYICSFLFPALFFLVVFTYWPVIRTFELSFYNWNMVSPNPKWVGLTNYSIILSSREFWLAAKNTILYIVLLLFLNLVIPYFGAFALARLIKKGQTFYKGIIFMPSVLSLAVASVIFLWIFNPLTGPLNMFLSMIGMEPPNWLKSNNWVIIALGVITAWKSFGYNFILLLAGMSAVPEELIEAARLENAGNRTIFWRIICPLTSSTALYVLVMTIIMGLQYVFVPIQMLTGGGPDQASTNLVFIVYQYAFNFFQTGTASACAIITLIIFAALIIVQSKILEKGVHYEN